MWIKCQLPGRVVLLRHWGAKVLPQPTKSHQRDLCRNNPNANAHANCIWTNAHPGNTGRSRIDNGDVDGVAGGDWVVALRRNAVAGVLSYFQLGSQKYCLAQDWGT